MEDYLNLEIINLKTNFIINLKSDVQYDYHLYMIQ